MGGHKTEETNYTTHVIVFLALTALMYAFAFLLVDHSKDVPARLIPFTPASRSSWRLAP